VGRTGELVVLSFVDGCTTRFPALFWRRLLREFAWRLGPYLAAQHRGTIPQEQFEVVRRTSARTPSRYPRALNVDSGRQSPPEEWRPEGFHADSDAGEILRDRCPPSDGIGGEYVGQPSALREGQRV
jgi:hypothetical protein